MKTETQTLDLQPSENYLRERSICMDYFGNWTEQDQIEFVEELLMSMHHHQHGYEQLNIAVKSG